MADASGGVLHVFMVGAIYQDIILKVDQYPAEDTKTRATSVQHRRGGNGGNSLAVLAQLTQLCDVKLNMIASFGGDLRLRPDTATTTTTTATTELGPVTSLQRDGVSLAHSVFHGPQFSQPTAYIIATDTSRTIVNENSLPEYTAADFTASVVPHIRALLTAHSHEVKGSATERVWVHFEGRSAEQILAMVTALRNLRDELAIGRNVLCISSEFEKPARHELGVLFPLVDVCFFSKLWVASQATDPIAYLEETLRTRCRPDTQLFATWGESGASVTSRAGDDVKTLHIPAPRVNAVDVVGAGDTFIAGIIFAMGSLRLQAYDAARFATALASCKCAMVGFPKASDAIQIIESLRHP